MDYYVIDNKVLEVGFGSSCLGTNIRTAATTGNAKDAALIRDALNLMSKLPEGMTPGAVLSKIRIADILLIKRNKPELDQCPGEKCIDCPPSMKNSANCPR